MLFGSATAIYVYDGNSVIEELDSAATLLEAATDPVPLRLTARRTAFCASPRLTVRSWSAGWRARRPPAMPSATP
jgi:hypothetical protein